MQTRKRAKSVSFGKKKEEKIEKEAIKKAPEETPVEEPKKSSEKAEVVERRVVPEKPQSDELSSTLPKEEKKEEETETPTHDVATPKEDFVTDTSPVEPSEGPHELEPKEDISTPDESDLPENAKSGSESSKEELSQPLETSPQATPPPVQPPSSEGEELSSTLPPSAFTIQTDGQEITAVKPEEGRKRFGIYFFVVAFLAFILGLGAMAAVSYFGLINLSLPKLSIPHSISVPGLSKPTPTPLPKPTATPTAVPVNLKAYSISVLNGSGITGQAGKVKDSLTTDGYTVASTGNADNNNYTKTEIAAKKSVSQDYLSKLEAELGKTLDVDSTVGPLQDSSTTDVTVTLGSGTAQ